MKHLQKAKVILKDINPNASIEYSKSSAGQASAHALIAIAEQQERRLLLEASKVAELSKIAEQIERIADKPSIHMGIDWAREER